YVQGISPNRELPVVWRIARGSARNKALIIVAIMALSVWAPWIFPWLLLVGGTYLAYEGAHKVWHWIQTLRGHEHGPTQAEIVERTPADEKQIVSNAVRTDLVLSVEIMLISLDNIDAGGWVYRLVILVVVALLMTVAVYGVVGLLVKMDDVGLRLCRRDTRPLAVLGAGLVTAMPIVFRVLSVVGVVAMLWVGGHILLANLSEVGVTGPYALVHAIEHAAHAPAVLTWIIDTALSAVAGLIWGLVVVAVVSLVTRLLPKKPPAPRPDDAEAPAVPAASAH
ncbi:MAG: DUF808 domain-containing protein, partial [Propionibacteriaceae bacterium]|nr:DUF808 domain-containing protein [Propionibacteriaceae bacterium]